MKKKVKLVQANETVGEQISKMQAGEVNFHSHFQRNPGIWPLRKKQKLILDLMDGGYMPPINYWEGKDGHLQILDGLQRLSTLVLFICPDLLPHVKPFVLPKNEEMPELSEKSFSALDTKLQQLLLRAPVLTVTFDSSVSLDRIIRQFVAINEKPTTLRAIEVLNAMYAGPAMQLLIDLAACQEFRDATRNKPKSDRMVDREMVLRSLAFLLTSYEDYVPDMNTFTVKALDKIRDASAEEKEKLANLFKLGMSRSHALLGDLAFRMPPNERAGGQRWGAIGKAVMEVQCWTFANMSKTTYEKLLERKKSLIKGFLHYCKRIPDFDDCFRHGTSDKSKVRTRFAHFSVNVIEEVLKMPEDPPEEVKAEKTAKVPQTSVEASNAKVSMAAKTVKPSSVVRKSPGQPRSKAGNKSKGRK